MTTPTPGAHALQDSAQDRDSAVRPKLPYSLQPARRRDKILGVIVGATTALLVIAIAWLLFAKNMQAE